MFDIQIIVECKTKFNVISYKEELKSDKLKEVPYLVNCCDISPSEIEGLVVVRRAHRQPAVLQRGPSQRALCRCKCGTCSEGWWPWPKAPVEGTSPERAWPHTAPLDGVCY